MVQRLGAWKGVISFTHASPLCPYTIMYHRAHSLATFLHQPLHVATEIPLHVPTLLYHPLHTLTASIFYRKCKMAAAECGGL